MTTTTFQLSGAQEQAKTAVLQWLTGRMVSSAFGGYEGNSPNTFRLFGYAGTGKTTIAKAIAQAVHELCGRSGTVFAAFTGKAASVLRNKGCTPASTVHGLIYRPVGEDEKGDPTFQFRRGERVKDSKKVDLIILDECSMIGGIVGKDLLRLGIPILVLGDTAQLPPVGDGGFFTNYEPDVLLTQIHRQATDSGILQMAYKVRNGVGLVHGDYLESTVVPLLKGKSLDHHSFDVVICGTHKKRKTLNDAMRRSLGITSVLPAQNDTLICTMNCHQLQLMNGERMKVLEVVEPWSEILNSLKVRVQVEGGRDLEITVDAGPYITPERDRSKALPPSVVATDFGYAITCHKSQGSQWDNVLVYDESFCFREHASRWLYTAITRAAKKVTVIK